MLKSSVWSVLFLPSKQALHPSFSSSVRRSQKPKPLMPNEWVDVLSVCTWWLYSLKEVFFTKFFLIINLIYSFFVCFFFCRGGACTWCNRIFVVTSYPFKNEDRPYLVEVVCFGFFISLIQFVFLLRNHKCFPARQIFDSKQEAAKACYRILKGGGCGGIFVLYLLVLSNLKKHKKSLPNVLKHCMLTWDLDVEDTRAKYCD